MLFFLRGSSFFNIGAVVLFALILTACGGPQAGEPTAIPADIVVPDQPLPVYADDAQRFTWVTPGPPVFAENNAGSGAGSSGPKTRPVVELPYQQAPSALGVVRGDAALRSEPGGSQIGSVPAGGTVTITGKTADGSAYAAFSRDGLAGWLTASAVTVYGGDDLIVVDTAAGPGPIATLLAEAMIPVEPSVLDGVGME